MFVRWIRNEFFNCDYCNCFQRIRSEQSICNRRCLVRKIKNSSKNEQFFLCYFVHIRKSFHCVAASGICDNNSILSYKQKVSKFSFIIENKACPSTVCSGSKHHYNCIRFKRCGVKPDVQRWIQLAWMQETAHDLLLRAEAKDKTKRCSGKVASMCVYFSFRFLSIRLAAMVTLGLLQTSG